MTKPEHKPYGLTTPCPECPFRTDIRPYLRPGRVREIEQGLVHGEFFCHKTTVLNDDDEYAETGKEMHCAGALILLEKLGRPSQMMRICERVNLYDPSKLDMGAPVFDSFEEMIKAQSRPTRRRRRRA